MKKFDPELPDRKTNKDIPQKRTRFTPSYINKNRLSIDIDKNSDKYRYDYSIDGSETSTSVFYNPKNKPRTANQINLTSSNKIIKKTKFKG